MTVINSDNIGNYYYNTLGTPNGLTGPNDFDTSPLPTFFSYISDGGAFSNSDYVLKSGTNVNFRLSNSLEDVTQNTARFDFYLPTSSSSSDIRTKNSSIATTYTYYHDINNTLPLQSFGFNNLTVINGHITFCLKNQWGLFILTTDVASSSPDWNNFRWRYMGWANNSIYTTQEDKEKALIYLEGSKVYRSTLLNFAHVNFHRRNDGLVQCLPTFGYSLNCQTPTPGADTTDLVLRNFDNKVVGKVNNFLLTKNLYEIGTVINNTNSDPDGGNNPYWLCLHSNPDWGSLLVRTWYTI